MKPVKMNYDRSRNLFVATISIPTKRIELSTGRNILAQELPMQCGMRPRRIRDEESGHIVIDYWYTDQPKVANNIAGYPEYVSMTDDCKQVIGAFRETSVSSKAEYAHLDIPENKFGSKLRPYQMAATKFFLDVWKSGSNVNPICTDEMGLGKTISAIGAILMDKSIRQILIVCQNSQLYNWERELRKWLCVHPDIDNRYTSTSVFDPDGYRFNESCMQVITPGKRIDKSVAITIISYSGIKANTRRRRTPWEDRKSNISVLSSIDFDLLIADEIQEMRNLSVKTRCMQLITGKRKLALTGTLMNKVSQAYYPLAWLAPRMFPNKSAFDVSYEGITGAKKLGDILRSNMLIGRPKTLVAKDMPPLTRILTPISGSKEGRERIDRLNKLFGQTVAKMEDAVRKAQTASSAEEANKIFESVSLGLSGQSIPFEEISRERRLVAESKVDEVIAIVKDRLQSIGDDKMVLFYHHITVGDMLEEALTDMGYGVARLDGSTRNRQGVIDSFVHGSNQVFLGSITAAGTGINLQVASYEIFAEVSWVASDNMQAEARIHRANQRFPCTAEYIILNDSIEARIMEVFMEKERIIKAFSS
jgi:SNF2 family DNA or RNA helicase